MPSYLELSTQFRKLSIEGRGEYMAEHSRHAIEDIATRTNRNVLCYSSAFLQKPEATGLLTSINHEDINGFMMGLARCDPKKELLLILHTPGGLAEAAQTIVEYLRNVFKKIDVAVSTYAMSAGTMIALGCDRVFMDRQSQLGPIDPQMFIGGRYYSAHSMVEQFKKAKQEISANIKAAHAWAPILHSIGPALLKEAQRTHSYGKDIIKEWLEKYMFSDHKSPAVMASNVAKYFSSVQHGVHGKRIGREEAKALKLKIVNLEDDPELQDSIMTLYHLITLSFESSNAVKIVQSSSGDVWIKNLTTSI